MSSLECNIEEDNQDIKEACNLAKHGKFDPGVYNILKKKPHLINFIPEGKGWAIIHHAVYWNYLSVVVRLLEIPSLDLTIKTHAYPLGHNKEILSLTPKELAEYFLGDRKKIIKLLTAVEDDSWKMRFNQEMKFFVSAQEGEDIVKPILPLFADALTQYKVTLVGATNCPKTQMMALLHQIFGLEDNNWTKVSEQIHDSLYGVDRGTAEMFKKALSEREFFENIIRFYTGPSYQVINDAMSRSFNKEKPTPAKDLSIALYALVLDSVLMCWEELKVVHSPTFRATRKKLDIQEGTQIMFTDFLSATTDRVTGKSFVGLDGTLLKFDNTASTPYRPKDITKFSSSTEDNECVYPVGAEFKVTMVDDSLSYRVVHLELLPKKD